MTQNPLIERYMQSFESALRRYDLSEEKEIAADLRSHIDEALAYGKPLDDVLQAIGPADVLARAYAVELKLNPRESSGKAVARILSVITILPATGLLSFIVVAGLGSLALGFLASAFAMIVIGAIEAIGVHLPHVQLAGVHPLLVVGMGLVTMLIGLVTGWALWLYVRAMVGMLRRLLARVRGEKS